ncbi:hypothetical protein FKW77_009431 [Venturia effusa]|uniref:SH3 domain-containing protein n=1 Tax=Venturia effusa TaxID=50376 RepID=A0A517L1Y5_9PEZI|nr:hypothetical protein FKW77_009431 [Venturia effusa]
MRTASTALAEDAISRALRRRHEASNDAQYRLEQQFASLNVSSVIKILWPELSGADAEGMTVVSDILYAGEIPITKIRWFVVVKGGRESYTCLPITTYRGSGCGKRGVVKSQHCIVYSGSKEPDPFDEELPSPGEVPMLSSIQVRPRDRSEKMFPASRINFAKIYTVEHNVKVYDFGDVRKSCLSLLVVQWKWVLNTKVQGVAMVEDDRKDSGVDAEGDDEHEQDQELVDVDKGKDESDDTEIKLLARGVALWPWAATARGYLAFSEGDPIIVTGWADENWGRGKNVRTGKTGVFPGRFFQVDQTT